MAKYFDKCILHIGTEKTGTTTLQSFLARNRKKLAEHGYFVPKSLSPYQLLANHERLTTISLDTAKLNDDLRQSAGLKTIDDIIAHRARVQQEFEDEIKRSNNRPLNLLLSNEHCHSRLTSDGEVQTLRDFLCEYAERFELIVYLRPQHELATSLYDQALRVGYTDIDVLPSLEGNKRRWVEQRYFDYNDLTLRWERIFGPGVLRPRIYVRNELVGGSIFFDFLQVICANVVDVAVSADENKSMSLESQIALNAVNRYARAHPDSVPSRVRARLIASLQRSSEGSGRRPIRSEAEEFFRRFTDSNESVRRRYFPQRDVLFKPDFAALPDQPSESPSEADALVLALLAISMEESR